jgi:hypothetical protein
MLSGFLWTISFLLTGKHNSYLQRQNVFARGRFVLRLTSTPQGSGAHQPEAVVVVPIGRGVVVPVG